MFAAACLFAAPPAPAATFSGDFGSAGGVAYDGGDVDTARDVVVDTFSAGGPYVYVLGEGNATYTDWVIIKYDGVGTKLASATVQGLADWHDYPYAGVLDSAGNLYVAGCLTNVGPPYYCDAVVRKYSPDLVMLASAAYDGASSDVDVFYDLAWDQNGNLIAVGNTDEASEGSALIYRYDEGLGFLSSATFHVAGWYDRAWAVSVTTGGDIYLAGERANPSYDVLTLKFDPDLVFQTSATFNGPGNATDRGYGITRDPSGNIYVVGSVDMGGVNQDMLVLKYSPSLVFLASATYGGAGADWAEDAIWEGNDLILTGADNSAVDWVSLRYSTGLALQASVPYDGGGSDYAYAVARGTGDYIYVAGQSNVATLDFRVKRYVVGDFGLAGSSVIAGAGFSGVGTSSMTAAWNSTYAAGTMYYARVSSGAFPNSFAGNASSDTFNLDAWFSGLSPNVVYYVQVGTSAGGPFTQLGSTASLAAVPTGVSFGAPGINTIPLSWSSAGNGTGVTYAVIYSTASNPSAPGGAPVVSTGSFSTSLTASGLAPATTFYFQVRAVNNNGIASSYTSPVSTVTLPVGVFTSSGFSGLGTTSLTAAWASSWQAGTFYYSRLSSGAFPNSFAGNASSDTAELFAGFSGLTPNVTYYVEVGTGAAGPFTPVGSTSTLAAPPSALTFGAPGISTITLSWSSSGNGPGAIYEIIYSTASNPSSPNGAVVVSTGGLATSLIATGLASSTTYYFKLRSINNNDIPSGYTSAVSTPTLPPGSVGPAGFSGVGTSSLTVAWTTTHPGGTIYYAWISSGAFPNSFAGNASSDTAELFAWFSGLSANVTYYVAVATVAAGPFTSVGSTSTLASVPTGVTFGAPGNNTVPVSWSAAGNGTGVTYWVRYSTAADPGAPGGAAVGSSGTAATSLVASNLDPATTFYFQVRAINNNGIASSYASPLSTVTLPDGVLASAGYGGVGVSSMTVSWTSSHPGGTMFYARISSGTFPNSFAGNASSDTFNFNAWFGGLSPNTSYYTQVSSAAGGPFTQLGSTSTLAAAPAGTTVLSASFTEAVLSWGANGNPALSPYELWRDLAAGFPSPVMSSYTATTVLVTGLSPGTTYYWKVRAVSRHGWPSLFDSTVTTTTLPMPASPAAPGAPGTAGIWITSVSWSWTASSGADSYQVRAASSPAVVMASPTPASFLQTGLAPNATFGIIVAGVNAAGVGPASTSAVVNTLAAPPAGSAAAPIGASSAAISWLINGNPSGTPAELQRSTDNAGFTSLSSNLATSYVDLGLAGCTSYYYRVRFRNVLGAASAFDGTVWFRTWATTAAPAGGLTADSVAGNRIGLTWTPSPTAGVTGYRLYHDNGTGSVDSGTPLAVLTSTETSYTTGVLASSASYAFVLRAKHSCGVEEPTGVWASAGSVGSLAEVRAAIKVPVAGQHVDGDRVTILAEPVSGAAGQIQSVRFQYRASGAPAWTDVPSANPTYPNPAMVSPFLTQWNADAAAAGSYELRAIAYNAGGTPDPVPAAVTVVVDPVHPDIAETMDSSGQIVKTQVVNSAVATAITSSGSQADDPVARIVLPPNVVTDSSTTITTVCNPTITTAVPSGLTAVGSAVRIELGSGQTQLNGAAEITLTYPDTVSDPSNLQIYTLNEMTGAWTKDFVSVVNTSSRTITGYTTHFSIFAVIAGAPAMANLDSVRVYPVPWKPNGGNADEGKPFTAGDPTSGVIFDRLPVAVGIKIYTLRGRLVTQFDTAAGTGAVRWDGTNLDGRDAASGGYFAVISAPGLKSVVKKIVIVR
ncbi:MAG: fibronectin type III domain-containing protein [Elusimicrobia bacterium]|nr:fibronectin type III domain-containing protein [Elusimicrobiota bacterium]